MSLELCVLGSGSGGNSTVVRSPWGTFLIDAGFGPRTTAERMGADGGIGLQVGDISAMVLTHLDHDHFNKNWFQTILKLGIRVFCAQERRDEIVHCPEALEAEEKLQAKRFVGPGPWTTFSAGLQSALTPDDDPAHLYRNVLVSLDAAKKLNNGEPRLWAVLFERLCLEIMQAGLSWELVLKRR